MGKRGKRLTHGPMRVFACGSVTGTVAGAYGVPYNLRELPSDRLVQVDRGNYAAYIDYMGRCDCTLRGFDINVVATTSLLVKMSRTRVLSNRLFLLIDANKIRITAEILAHHPRFLEDLFGDDSKGQA